MAADQVHTDHNGIQSQQVIEAMEATSNSDYARFRATMLGTMKPLEPAMIMPEAERRKKNNEAAKRSRDSR